MPAAAMFDPLLNALRLRPRRRFDVRRDRDLACADTAGPVGDALAIEFLCFVHSGTRFHPSAP